MTAISRPTAAALAAAFVSLALCATACGGSSGSPAGPAHGGSGAPARITYWSWTKNSQQVVDEFNATHKDVHVTFSQIVGGADGYAKIFAAIKAGNGPDVFNCEYTELPQFVAQGDVRDISPYLSAGVRSRFTSGATGLTTLGGRSWAVPVDIEPEMFYYRKDLFRRYHLTVPTTWAQFRATAEALKKADPKAVLANFPTDDYTIASLSAQAGARWFGTSGNTWKVRFDDPATRKVEDYWQGMVADHLVSTAASTSPALAANQTEGAQIGMIDPPFQAAYLPALLPGQAGKWAVAPLPTWDGTAASGALGGSSTAVSKGSRSAAASARFATWLATNPDAVRTRVAGGTSSALPADPKMADIAAKAFSSSYFGGQDLYAAFKPAAASLKPGWVWGPTMVNTIPALTDGLGRLGSGGTIADAVASAQAATVRQMKSTGLDVTTG